MSEELLPCPFCGSSELITHREPTQVYVDMGAAWIRCNKCDCRLCAPEYEKLIILWNTRPVTAPLQKRIEELEAALTQAVGALETISKMNMSFGHRLVHAKEIAKAALGELKDFPVTGVSSSTEGRATATGLPVGESRSFDRSDETPSGESRGAEHSSIGSRNQARPANQAVDEGGEKV